MVPTRRGLLGVVGVLAVGAGCGGIDTGTRTETGTVAAGGEPPGDAGDSRLTDPATVVVRGDPGDDRPPVALPEEDGRPSRFDRPGMDVVSDVIADRETAASVETTAAADDEAVRSFLADTDFTDESVYLQTLRVLACYDVELCSISWTTGEVETDYGRRLKPYTESCPADTRVFETRLIRVPGRIGDANAFSTSLGGSSCRPSDSEQATVDGSDTPAESTTTDDTPTETTATETPTEGV